MGERSVRNAEVEGSIPFGSTRRNGGIETWRNGVTGGNTWTVLQYSNTPDLHEGFGRARRGASGAL